MKKTIFKIIIIFILLISIIGFDKIVYTNPKNYDSNQTIYKKETITNLEKEKSLNDIFIKDDKNISIKNNNLNENENENEKKETKNFDEIETNQEEQKEKDSIIKKNGYKIVIDAGHQMKANTEKEPIGPEALEMKQKVSTGTQGCISKLPEYELTLDISKRLKDLLENDGYDVVMIREINDVNISNAERAQIANNSNANIFIRIHANGSEDSSIKGVSTLCPTENNEYCGFIALDSYDLSKYIVDELSSNTGDINRDVSQVDNMTGINYCQIPVSIVEIGFMTNEETDILFQTEDYKNKIAYGILNGINKYFDNY